MPLKDPALSIGSYHFEDGQRYLVKLVDIVDAPPSKDHPDWPAQIKFVFAVHDMDRDPILDDEGEQAFINPYASASTGPKTKKTRPWLQTLIGREITNDDTGEGLTTEAIGKWASVVIVDNANGYSEIASLSSVKKTAPKSKAEDDE